MSPLQFQVTASSAEYRHRLIKQTLIWYSGMGRTIDFPPASCFPDKAMKQVAILRLHSHVTPIKTLMRGLLRQDTGFCLYPWTGARRKGCQPHPGTPAGWSWDEQKPGLPRHPWIPSARSSQQCWCSTLAPWRSHYWQLQKRQKEEVTIYLSGRFPCRAAFVPQMSTCHFQHPFCHQLPSTGSTMKNGKTVSADTPLISPFKTQYMCKNIHQIFQLWFTKELQ